MFKIASGILGAALALGSAAAMADGDCVGISYDQANNIAGTAVNADSSIDAQNSAVFDCQQKGGQDGCSRAIYGYCGGYAALYVSDFDSVNNVYHFGVGTAPAATDAEQKAANYCAHSGASNCQFQLVVPGN